MSEDKYGAIFIISFFYHYSTILGNFYYLRIVGVCIYNTHELMESYFLIKIGSFLVE